MLSHLHSRLTPLWPLVMLAFIVLLSLLPDAQLLLRFESSIIETHQWWRLISAHWVHLSWQHTLLNALGLLLVWYLMPRGSWILWWGFSLITGVIISLVLLYVNHVDNYVGASGVLHGLLILSAYMSQVLSPMRRLLFIGIIIAKLVWEQTLWYSGDDLGDFIGGYVVIDAHLWGGITACLVLCTMELKKSRLFSRYSP